MQLNFVYIFFLYNSVMFA